VQSTSFLVLRLSPAVDFPLSRVDSGVCRHYLRTLVSLWLRHIRRPPSNGSGPSARPLSPRAWGVGGGSLDRVVAKGPRREFWLPATTCSAGLGCVTGAASWELRPFSRVGQVRGWFAYCGWGPYVVVVARLATVDDQGCCSLPNCPTTRTDSDSAAQWWNSSSSEVDHAGVASGQTSLLSRQHGPPCRTTPFGHVMDGRRLSTAACTCRDRDVLPPTSSLWSLRGCCPTRWKR